MKNLLFLIIVILGTSTFSQRKKSCKNSTDILDITASKCKIKKSSSSYKKSGVIKISKKRYSKRRTHRIISKKNIATRDSLSKIRVSKSI